jgi:transcription initiation factor IIF auxiliary subunit
MENKYKLVAAFETNKSSEIIVEKYGKRQHYDVRLFLEGDLTDILSVTYVLHESYYDPIRTSRNRSKKFEIDVTSYGDYMVIVKIALKNREVVISETLGNALRNHYLHNNDPVIERAIANIKAN